MSVIIVNIRRFVTRCLRGQRVDQERCLGCVKAHLADRGQFIMHVLRPRSVFDESGVRPESLDWEVVDPRTNQRVRRYERRKRIDLDHQVIHVDLIYRIDGCDQEIVELLSLSYFYEEQMRALRRRNNFQIIEEFGYFDGQPIANGSELIFVCR